MGAGKRRIFRIAIGADHGGFTLKQKLVRFLESKNFSVADLGTHTQKPCDYPLIGYKLARAVSLGQFDRGILICKSGLGMSIAANKVAGIRAALCRDVAAAISSRQHNDANVLILAANFTTEELAREILDAWLKARFAGGRHARRVRQIKKIENLKFKIKNFKSRVGCNF